MKEFEKEILATIFFIFFLSVTIAMEIKLPISSELWVFAYLILLSVWAVHRKLSVKLFYYLSIIFLPLMIISEPLGNTELTNNIAAFVFYFLILSLVLKFRLKT